MPEPPIMPSTDLVIATSLWSARCAASATRAAKQGAGHPDKPAAQCFVAPSQKRKAPRGAQRRWTWCRSMHRRPHLLLRKVQEAGENDQEDHDLEADALTLHEMRFGRPHQERRNIFRILVERLWRAVVIGDLPVLQGRRHGRIVAREIFVVVAVLRERKSGRRTFVALEIGSEVIRALLLVLRENV